ncbi:MAG: hypothetical protein U0787_20525 [Polyangia bacterium]
MAELSQFQSRTKKLPAWQTCSFFRYTKRRSPLGIMMWRRRMASGLPGDHDMPRQSSGCGSESCRLRSIRTYGSCRMGHIAVAVERAEDDSRNITIATLICVGFALIDSSASCRPLCGDRLACVYGGLAGADARAAPAQISQHQHRVSGFHHLGKRNQHADCAAGSLWGGETEGRRCPVGISGALTHTILSTATAMLAASLAYGSLIVTDFRGFSQFGLIGGAGMIFVWICSMIVVPPVVLLGERLRPGVFTPKTNLWRIPFCLWQKGGLLPALDCTRSGHDHVVRLSDAARFKIRLEWNSNNLRSGSARSAGSVDRMYAMGMGDVEGLHRQQRRCCQVMPDQAELMSAPMRKRRTWGQAHLGTA